MVRQNANSEVLIDFPAMFDLSRHDLLREFEDAIKSFSDSFEAGVEKAGDAEGPDRFRLETAVHRHPVFFREDEAAIELGGVESDPFQLDRLAEILENFPEEFFLAEQILELKR